MTAQERPDEYAYTALGALFHSTVSFLTHDVKKLHRILSGPAVDKAIDTDSYAKLTMTGSYVTKKADALSEWVKGIDSLEVDELSSSEKSNLFALVKSMVGMINHWSGRYTTLRQSTLMFDALPEEDMKDDFQNIYRMVMDLYNASLKLKETAS